MVAFPGQESLQGPTDGSQPVFGCKEKLHGHQMCVVRHPLLQAVDLPLDLCSMKAVTFIMRIFFS